ncbi:hypothetical protein [Alterisphingorhabdus coralli]|uniref:Uncharacterized protein n=1 Tax=Alterisphingorhabdus coralli TaxID=3071408 RepID=A0AA97I1C6_9SPHN|nr:hypothetical protein [Parasphingorhabdus sp. SCSIO 66989]WOE75917.1 hypothetical protein RB602_04165 [Parasphingorhabdus sp. SCSIO 66989]
MSSNATATPSIHMPLIPALDDDHLTRLFLALALFQLACFVVFIPAWLLDTRILDSAAIWTKPQKFHISLALHFATLAVLAQLLPRDFRTGPLMIIFGYLAAISMIYEFAYIGLKAAQGGRSHFNYDTPAESTAYALMGVGAVLLVFVAMVLAVQIWRKGDRSRKGLWLGSIIGLSTGFALTLLVASTMSSTSRYVGAPLSGGGEVFPFFGWSREYGDLRPSHFVALHLMQTVPLAGYLANRFRWPAIPVVLGVTALQIALCLALFYQALAGQPIWPT